MNNTNMVQTDVSCIKDGMKAFFSESAFKKKYIPVTIKFVEYDTALKDQKIVLIGENGETIKKDTGEDKVFCLSNLVGWQSISFGLFKTIKSSSSNNISSLYFQGFNDKSGFKKESSLFSS